MNKNEQLQFESPLIHTKVDPFYLEWKLGKISDAHFCLIYLIIYLQQRNPKNWLGAPLFPQPKSDKSPSGQPLLKDFFCLNDLFKPSRLLRLNSDMTLFELVQCYNFRGVPYSVHRSLVHWMLCEYSLNLTTEIPKPLDVLKMQTQGTRCVSVLVDSTNLAKIIDGKRDSFEFTQHDLIHADHFFQNKDFFWGQIGFCNLMLSSFEMNVFAKMIQTDSVFQTELEYGISDMNSFCVHLLKYLRAIILGYFLRAEGKTYKESLSTETQLNYLNFYENLLRQWLMPKTTLEAAMRINTPHYKSFEDSIIIKDFFENVGLESKKNWQRDHIHIF